MLGKMPTPLIWKALTINHRMNGYLYKIPVGWNSVRKEFYSTALTRSNWKEYFFWLCGMGVIIFSIICSAYIVFRQLTIPKSNLTLGHTIIFTIVIIADCLVLAIGLFVARLGAEPTHILNVFIKCYQDFRDEKFNNEGNLKRKKGHHIWLTPEGELDNLGIFFYFVFVPMPVIPLMVAIFVTPSSLDLYGYLFEDIIPSIIWEFWGSKIFFKCITFMFCYVAFADGTRCISLIGYILLLGAHCDLGCIKTLQTTVIRNNTTLKRIYKSFTYLQIVHGACEVVTAVCNFTLLSSGAILSASLNFVTLRFFNRGIPMGIWFIFLIASITVPITMKQMIPRAINVHEYSQDAIWRWTKQTHTQENQQSLEGKYLRRKFRALRAIRFYAGLNGYNFFMLSKSLITTYMEAIVDYTINLLFLWPVDSI